MDYYFTLVVVLIFNHFKINLFFAIYLDQNYFQSAELIITKNSIIDKVCSDNFSFKSLLLNSNSISY